MKRSIPLTVLVLALLMTGTVLAITNPTVSDVSGTNSSTDKSIASINSRFDIYGGGSTNGMQAGSDQISVAFLMKMNTNGFSATAMKVNDQYDINFTIGAEDFSMLFIATASNAGTLKLFYKAAGGGAWSAGETFTQSSIASGTVYSSGSENIGFNLTSSGASSYGAVRFITKRSYLASLGATGLQVTNIVSATYQTGTGQPDPISNGPYTVATADTKTSISNTAVVLNPCQRKTFFAAGLFWAFYSDMTNMLFCTSNDGTTWSSATTVRACADSRFFAIWYDGTYVHYCYGVDATSSALLYRRGTPNSDGTITWSAEQTAVAADASNWLTRPSVCVDGSGYAYIVYEKGSSSNRLTPYCVKSGNNDGTWGTSAFDTQLNSSSNDWRSAIIPIGSTSILAVYGQTRDTVKARRWDGSSWHAQTATASNVITNSYFSVVTDGTDAYIAYLKQTTYDIVFAKYTVSTDTMGSDTTVQSVTSNSAPQLCYDSGTGKMYCFWLGSPSLNHVYYKKYSGGSWDANPTDWITETSLSSNPFLVSFDRSMGTCIGLMYMTSTSSPYNVRYALLVLAPNDRCPSTGTGSCSIIVVPEFPLGPLLLAIPVVVAYIYLGRRSVIKKWRQSADM